MTLTSSKTELVALSEAVEEVLFMIQLLGCMKISVKLPVMVTVDNVSAIFMAVTIPSTSCSKHMDISTMI